jgi:hypothetical protein
MAMEYNGFSGFQGYNKNSATNNPINITGPLPVELTTFTSNVVKNNVTLKWTTNKEINNKGFSIERTVVGNIENWFESGFVPGAGNSNSPENYQFTDNNLSSGIYKYRLKQTDFNGNFTYYDLTNTVSVGVPEKFGLSQNYPNPFNPTTKINFDLPVNSKVSLKIYDITGREISMLLNETKDAGFYSVSFNASGFPSGVYFYKLVTQNFSEIKRMILVK